MAYVNFKSGTLDQITSTSGKPTNLLSISTDITSIFKGDLNITNRVIDASVNNKILAIRKIDASGNYDSDYINFDFASPYTSGNGILVDNEQGTISLDPNFELFEITSTLPSSNIKKNKIYLVPKQDDSSVANNIYTEYHYLGSGTWEIMGDRQTDIANSLKVAALPTYVSPVPDVSVGDSYDTAFAKLQAKKQDVLISGTNIKTIDGSTLLGSGNIDLYNSLYNRLNTVFVHKPDIIYQYQSGYTQIFGQKSGSITNTWDLTNLDLTPYKYIKVFIKGSNDGNTDTYLSSPIICTISLDASIIEGGATYYSGVGVSSYPNNHNRLVLAFCAVDSTKTKFQLIRTVSLYGTAGSDASDKGRYLYRIEGWYDDQESEAEGGSSLAEIDPTVPSYVKNITENDISTWNNKLSSESDPIFTASAAAGITSNDISTWNGKQDALVSGTNIKTVNSTSLLGSGNIDAEDVVLGHVVPGSGLMAAPKFYRFAGTYSIKGTDAIATPDYESTEETLVSDKLYVDITTKKAYWYDTNPNLLAKNRLQEVIQPDLSSYYTKTEIDNAGYITSETSLSKGATSGNGNAVTDISVSGHEITLTKGSTFITSSDIASYADGAEYDSTNHLIYLKHGNTRLSNPINAADFIKDGMVSTVTVDTPSTGINTGVTCLIVTFNTDAGESPIELPISQIFNANNYYTKTEIDNAGYLTSYTETDPIFSASAAAGIQSSDITNWNSKTSNIGTVTGVKMNNESAISPSNGIVDLGTVITSETSLSKGTTSGSGNAVTDIAVSGHQITLTKGSTFLTAHQSIKTINNNTITGTGNITINELPSVTSSDNGKVLMVVNGVWTLVTPAQIYSGSGTPNNAQGNNGDIYLQV